jgi:hypothetical protein
MISPEMETARLAAASLAETRKGPRRAGEDAAGRGVAGGDEERNLGFWVLGFLGFRVCGLAGVCSPELGEV